MLKTNKLLFFLNIAIISAIVVVLIANAWNSPTASPPNPAGQAMYVSPTGNVGIGTTGPGEILHVLSNSDASIKLEKTGVNPASLIINVAANVTFDNSYTAGTDLNLRYSGDVCVGAIDCLSKLSVFGNAVIGTNYAGVTAAPTNGLIVEGNVGIGTPNPSQKLDVVGYVRGQSGLCIGGDCRTSWPISTISSDSTVYNCPASDQLCGTGTCSAGLSLDSSCSDPQDIAGGCELVTLSCTPVGKLIRL